GRRLFLHEVLLPLHQSHPHGLSRHARQDCPQRFPSHVLGARQIRRKAPHPQNRLQSPPPQNQLWRRPRRRQRPLRLPPRNRLRLRLPPLPTRPPLLTPPFGVRRLAAAFRVATSPANCFCSQGGCPRFDFFAWVLGFSGVSLGFLLPLVRAQQCSAASRPGINNLSFRAQRGICFSLGPGAPGAGFAPGSWVPLPLRTSASSAPLRYRFPRQPKPVIPAGADRFSPARRFLARRAAERGLCAPCASPGWRDLLFSFSVSSVFLSL